MLIDFFCMFANTKSVVSQRQTDFYNNTTGSKYQSICRFKRKTLTTFYRLKNVFQSNVLNEWKRQLCEYDGWETKGNMKRKVKWWCHCQCPYNYSDIQLFPVGYIQLISEIEYYILKALKMAFPGVFDWVFYDDNFPNCCHGSYYTKNDECGIHSDNEAIFDSVDNECAMFSFSLGGSGKFKIYSSLKTNNKPIESQNPLHTITLEDGDICVMFGMFQRFYKHSVENINPRINLTFRSIRCHDQTCKNCCQNS